MFDELPRDVVLQFLKLIQHGILQLVDERLREMFFHDSSFEEEEEEDDDFEMAIVVIVHEEFWRPRF